MDGTSELSTPSLGITGTLEANLARVTALPASAFNSLSRDHFYEFLNLTEEQYKRAFNSLSRDHVRW